MRPRSAHGVIVAIRDPDAHPVPLNSRWADVLRLEVPDITMEGQRDPKPESLAAQAGKLVAFVHAHRKAPLVAFHSNAGVSRSRTAASVVCNHYGWPYAWSAPHDPWAFAIRGAYALAESEADYRRMQDPAVWAATRRGFEALLDRRLADMQRGIRFSTKR